MRAVHAVRIAGVLAISLGLGAGAHAGGSVPEGQARSLACTACHSTDDADSDTPHLAGQLEGYLARQLAAFRTGERVHPMMDAIARQLSDADIAGLAAFWSRQPAGSDTALPPAALAIRRSHMAFPRDFPRGFVLYLTANDAEKHVVGRSYINAIGFAAARAGRELPDGSIVMVVNYAPRLGPDQQPIRERDGTWVADKIVSYSAMEARAGWGSAIPEILRNANWNYALFGADGRPRGDANQAACLACHKQQAAVSYLFTFNELRDRATAP